MSETYLIQGISKADDHSLAHGTYIVLLEVNRRPPHLSILIEGKLFSLGVKGPKLDLPLEVQLRHIKVRKLQTLFIKLRTSLAVHHNFLYKEAAKHTLKYERAEAPIATCLSPIKSFCSGIFGINVSEVNFIFDLLPVLYGKNLIEGCSHYHLEKKLKNNSCELHKYTMKEIYDSIVNFRTAEVLLYQ